MPRQTRFPGTGIPQLIRQRGHNGARICVTGRDFLALYGHLLEASVETESVIHAYAVLPHGLYLLATPQRKGGVSKMMQAVGRQYVPWFNAEHDRSGALWEGRYRACLVEPSIQVLDCYRYVEQHGDNRHSQADVCGYRWSSGRAHLDGQNDTLIDDHTAYLELGRTPVERQEAYRRLCAEPLCERVLTDIGQSLASCLAYATDTFKDEIERTWDYQVRPGKPGRPRSRPGAGGGDAAPPPA